MRRFALLAEGSAISTEIASGNRHLFHCSARLKLREYAETFIEKIVFPPILILPRGFRMIRHNVSEELTILPRQATRASQEIRDTRYEMVYAAV